MPTTTPATAASLPLLPATLLVDTWYAQALAPAGATDLDAALAVRFGERWSRLARRHAWLRGVLWFAVSRPSLRVVCPFAARGLPVFLFLHWLLSKQPPRLHLVEFLRAEPAGWRARAKEALHVGVFRWLLPRMLDGAQVMTRWEVEAYARKYHLPAERFRFIAFPMVVHLQPLKPPASTRACMVMASGRAACDWATLMAAAQGAAWPLTIVCSSQDRAAVEALNLDGRARVLCEISHQEHQQLLSEATVYALAMREQRASSGQVRLARAIESGVPVVASAVLGLDGYLEDGTTALAVPVGDAARLRAAIDSLWCDADARARLRQRAHDAMHERSLEAYVERIRTFIDSGTATAEAPGAQASPRVNRP